MSMVSVLGAVLVAGALLQPVGENVVQAATGFVPREHFVVSTEADAKVRICMVFGFEHGFLMQKSQAGSVPGEYTVLGDYQHDAPKAMLAAYDVLQTAPQSVVKQELGEHPNGSVAYAWELLTRQPAGQPGLLLTRGANVFVDVPNNYGRLWDLLVIWYDECGGWTIYAVRRTGGEYGRGYRIFVARPLP